MSSGDAPLTNEPVKRRRPTASQSDDSSPGGRMWRAACSPLPPVALLSVAASPCPCLFSRLFVAVASLYKIKRSMIEQHKNFQNTAPSPALRSAESSPRTARASLVTTIAAGGECRERAVSPCCSCRTAARSMAAWSAAGERRSPLESRRFLLLLLVRILPLCFSCLLLQSPATITPAATRHTHTHADYESTLDVGRV